MAETALVGGGEPGKQPNRGTVEPDWDATHPPDGEHPNRPQKGLRWDVVQVKGWPDRAIAAISATQFGLITRDQLVGLGLRRGAIEHALARGRLTPVHRGVYALAQPALAPRGKELAAVLACGHAALLSHHSAAAVWGFESPPEGEIDVTVVGRDAGRRRVGIRVHRIFDIDRHDIRRLQNVPITAPARTLLDIAGDLSYRELERAFDDGLVRRILTREAVLSVLVRTPRRPGCGRLGALANSRQQTTTVTRSEAEERFLALVRRGRLPEPDVNVRIGRYVADFLWRDARLIVEIDGYAFHSSRRSFERDHERDLELKAAGFDVLRFTWRQIVEEPELVLVWLARALALALAGLG